MGHQVTNTCATKLFVCTTYMQTTPLQFDFDAQSTGWQIDSRVTHESRCTLLLRHTSPPASEIAGTGPSDPAGGWEGAIQSYNHSAQGGKSYPLPTKTNGFARVLVRVLVAFLKEKKLLSMKEKLGGNMILKWCLMELTPILRSLNINNFSRKQEERDLNGFLRTLLWIDVRDGEIGHGDNLTLKKLLWSQEKSSPNISNLKIQ